MVRCDCRKQRRHAGKLRKCRAGNEVDHLPRFSSLPSADPLTVCFLVPWTYLSEHALIIGLVRERLSSLPSGNYVRTVQYVPRNVINGTSKLDDRWLVTLTSERAKQELLRGLIWRGYMLRVRVYSDVLKEEYNKYMRTLAIDKAMKALRLS